jgi:hypothetical protein
MISDTASIPLVLLLLRDHQNRRTPRKWLPRRYRRSSAQNIIKCSSPSCVEPFPSCAHTRASPRARAGTDACTNLRSVLDPSIGARPLHRCSTFCWLTSRPPLAWILAHQRTTAVFRPSKNLHRLLRVPSNSGGALFFRAESSLRFTLRRLVGRANGFTHAPALAPVPSPLPRLARHLRNLGPHLPLAKLAPTIPVWTPLLAAPSHPGAAAAPPQAFARRRLPRAGAKGVD